MKWLLLLLSLNLYAQDDPRTHITSVPADPIADTNKIKNISVVDAEYMFSNQVNGITTYEILNAKVASALDVGTEYPSAVFSYSKSVPTPWAEYSANTFYFLAGGTDKTLVITVPVAQGNYPAAYPWGLNDLLTVRIVYDNPQLQSEINPDAIQDGTVKINDPGFDPNTGDPVYSSATIRAVVSGVPNTGTFWLTHVPGYTDFYGLNVTGFSDYPANTIPRPFDFYTLYWNLPDHKSVDSKALVNILLNVVKNNISRIEALEALHP